MRKYTVTKPVEITLSGQKYLLEEGDEIVVENFGTIAKAAASKLLPLMLANKDKILGFIDNYFKKKFGQDYKEKGKAEVANLDATIKQKADEIASQIIEGIKQWVGKKLAVSEGLVTEDYSPATLIALLGLVSVIGPIGAYYVFSKIFNFLADLNTGAQRPAAKPATKPTDNKQVLAKMEQEQKARREAKAAKAATPAKPGMPKAPPSIKMKS